MGTRRRLATVALLLFAAAAFAAGANAEVIQSGDVRVNFLAKFAPTTLPRETPAPITVEVGGKISTTDGSTPPALRNLRVELNSAGRIESAGLPSCAPSLLQSTDSEAALAAAARQRSATAPSKRSCGSAASRCSSRARRSSSTPPSAVGPGC